MNYSYNSDTASVFHKTKRSHVGISYYFYHFNHALAPWPNRCLS